MGRVLPILVASVGLGGCHWGLLGVTVGGGYARGPYEPNAIASELGPMRVRTLGCLDVGLAPLGDRSDLVDVHVGNRCTHPERIDVARLGIQMDRGDGVEQPASVYDPHGEVVVLHVGGAERGRERLRIDGMGRAQRVCFSLGAIAPDAPDARPSPMCFRRGTGEWIFDGGQGRPA